LRDYLDAEFANLAQAIEDMKSSLQHKLRELVKDIRRASTGKPV
jgi:phage shock protein A